MTEGLRPHTANENDIASTGILAGHLALLVIETDPARHLAIVHELSQAGWQLNALQIATEAELEQALVANQWDMALANPNQPGFFQRLASLQQHDPLLPCLIVADEIQDDLAIAALRAGARDFVVSNTHEHNNPAHFASHLADVIRRELSITALRRSQQLACAQQASTNTLFRRLTESIPECVWVLDLAAGRMSFVSQAYEKIWGRNVEDLLQNRLDWLRYVHPDDQQRMKQARDTARSGGLIEEFRVIRPDGSLRWLHLTTFPIHDGEGRMQSIGGVATDVTHFVKQREELATTLAREQQRAEIQQHILDALPANIALIDEKGRIIASNAAWQQAVSVHGLKQYAMGGNYLQAHHDLADHQDPERAAELIRFAAAIQGVLAGGLEPVSRIYPLRVDEQLRWYRVTVAPVHTQQTRGGVVMHVEITERMLAEQRALELAHYDSLTRLPNRLLFRDRLQTAMNLARRNQTKLAVCFIDLDRFKGINESLGHTLGDRLLCLIAERLKDCVRETDTVSRFGGDEFALILPDLHAPDDCLIVIERIIASLAASCTIDSHELFITASIGITVFPDDTTEAELLLQHADTAMYRAKEEGRNNYQFFTAEMNANALEAIKLERDLRYALDNEEFLLHYQPKASCQSGRIVGFEALLRWQHPVRGLVSPLEFIPLLEDTGLIIPVGAWVLQTACRQIKQWQLQGFANVSVAVNVSGKQMTPELCNTVASALKTSDLEPGYLELELTESQLMKDAENIISTLHRLKALGVSISVDDFGTGYSSLAYLKRFPLDTLKVDRAFIQDITADPSDVSITRAIITLAHSFNLQVVAEGVETAGQLNLLIANQCDVIQGYFFSRPLPVERAGELLHQDHALAAEQLACNSDALYSLLTLGLAETLQQRLQTVLPIQQFHVANCQNADQAFEQLAQRHFDAILLDAQSSDRNPGAKTADTLELLSRIKLLYPDTLRLLYQHTQPTLSAPFSFECDQALASGLIFRQIEEHSDNASLRADIQEACRQSRLATENRQLQRKVEQTRNELEELNGQLRGLLATRDQQLRQHEALADSSRDLLHQLPWPILGVADDHSLVFANGAAVTLFPGLMIGQLLEDCLGPEAQLAGRYASGFDQIAYKIHRHVLGSQSQASGSLLLFLPENSS